MALVVTQDPLSYVLTSLEIKLYNTTLKRRYDVDFINYVHYYYYVTCFYNSPLRKSV